MSLDNNSECVKSKYFVGKSAMDESLSDFQEVKQSCKGPKPVEKAVKPKAKKVIKRIKGQKDIKTAFKGKKNELLAYSKEFDTVCKKSGLDIDSEQLQLAIALSKSLQTESSSNPESTQTLSSQDRASKIRKTLQEYGFKVPEAKITKCKKIKKHRKEYKLLTISKEERNQIISGKYSQILFQNLACANSSQNHSNYQESDARVFNIAANIAYECIKDNCIFYINNLVEKSTSDGSLLRDWSDIPGRPVSPKLIDSNIMNFKEITCSQDELDFILSGPIKPVKDIISSKHVANLNKYNDCEVPPIVIDDEEKVADIKKDIPKTDKIETKPSHCKLPVFAMKLPTIEVIDIKSPVSEVDVDSNKPKFIQPYRSCSPDIFDDEISSTLDNSKPVAVLSQEHKTKLFTEDNFMDLTQGAVLSHVYKSFQLSQNVTKRKSNDFMEITGCVVGSSQPIREEIDLTQSFKEMDNMPGDCLEIDSVGNITENVSRNQPLNNAISPDKINNENIDERHELVLTKDPQAEKDNIDLTQSSNDDDIEIIMVNENEKLLDEKEYEGLDLTQSSKSTDIDDLPFVNLGNTQRENTLDETIIMTEEEYIGLDNKIKKSMMFESEANNHFFDLTQALMKNTTESCNNSFYEEFVHDHSENTDEGEQNDNINKSKTGTIRKESNDIDLTQSSGTSEEHIASPRLLTSIQNIPNNSSLGKKDDVSIDYDELDDNSDNNSLNKSEDDNSLKLKYDSSKPETHNDIEIVDTDNEGDINSSQYSVFHISDNELDYSLRKSRHNFPRDNFDFGGISVLDNVTALGSFRKSLNEERYPVVGTNEHDIEDDSFLPIVNVKGTRDIVEANKNRPKSAPISPIKTQNFIKNNGLVLQTPKNSEYIIKTDNVTPMLDYASMTTPQRNRELDKYGLKPFKRKRAIQILTHIYNQTHPIIEQLVDEHEPSPSKRPRTDTAQVTPSKNLLTLPGTSPLKTLAHATSFTATPTKLSKSPRISPLKSRQISPLQVSPKKSLKSKTEENIVKDACVYEVTSEEANIRTIECSPDDWVFQKREKAKVHSCRVPLHIAFHNYVSSRRFLREAILKYEPVNIDVIHKDLVGYGHRYDPKDLLKFLDKKCITVKTIDNNSRNNKR